MNPDGGEGSGDMRAIAQESVKRETEGIRDRAQKLASDMQGSEGNGAKFEATQFSHVEVPLKEGAFKLERGMMGGLDSLVKAVDAIADADVRLREPGSRGFEDITSVSYTNNPDSRSLSFSVGLKGQNGPRTFTMSIYTDGGNSVDLRLTKDSDHVAATTYALTDSDSRSDVSEAVGNIKFMFDRRKPLW